MEANNVKAPDRLRLLLPWLNGDLADGEDVVHGFVHATLDAWAGESNGDTLGLGYSFTLGEDHEALRAELLEVLEAAEPVGDQYKLKRVSFPSLTASLIRARENPDNLPADAAARREVLDGGAFRMLVSETTTFHDLALYCFMRTLAEPGTVRLARCPAPAPRDWSRRCGRYLLSGGTVGRPREYCRDACRVRANSEREQRR